MINNVAKRQLIYSEYQDQILEEVNNALDSVIFGGKQSGWIPLFNIYHLYAQLAWENSFEVKNLRCMSDVMYCNRIKVFFINEVYGLNIYIPGDNSDPSDPNNPNAIDGVGFMSIENTDPSIPTNRIK